jgi:hypothetical protein
MLSGSGTLSPPALPLQPFQLVHGAIKLPVQVSLIAEESNLDRGKGTQHQWNFNGRSFQVSVLQIFGDANRSRASGQKPWMNPCTVSLSVQPACICFKSSRLWVRSSRTRFCSARAWAESRPRIPRGRGRAVHRHLSFQVLSPPIQNQFPPCPRVITIGVARGPVGTPVSPQPNGSRVSGTLPESRRPLWERTNLGLGIVERSTESFDSTLISLPN